MTLRRRSGQAARVCRGADYVLCAAHSVVLDDSAIEAHLLRAVREEVMRRQVASNIDIETGCLIAAD